MKNKKMKIARMENDMNQQQLADAVGEIGRAHV